MLTYAAFCQQSVDLDRVGLPMLRARAIACDSMVGFGWGSQMTTASTSAGSTSAGAAQYADDRDILEFNLHHVLNHVTEAVDHQRKTIAVLCAYFPAVRDELGRLTEITDPACADRSVGLPLAGLRCAVCGEPRTPGGRCADPECEMSGDPGQRARDRGVCGAHCAFRSRVGERRAMTREANEVKP